MLQFTSRRVLKIDNGKCKTTNEGRMGFCYAQKFRSLYLFLPPFWRDLKQGLFYSGDFMESGEWTQSETHTLLDYAGHWFTRCNMSQMSLLDLDSLDVTWVRYVCLFIAKTWPSSLVLCCYIYAVYPPKGIPAEVVAIWPWIWHWSWYNYNWLWNMFAFIHLKFV